MSILADLGILKPSRPVRTAGSMLLLDWEYGKQIGIYDLKPAKMGITELNRIKMKLVVKNAMEAGLVDADKLSQIIRETSSKNSQ